MYEPQHAGFGALSGYLEQVEIRRIHRRDSFDSVRDELGPLEELMKSIMERGLLEPIVVRPANDGFEVVAGNRRYEACKLLKFSKLPCHIVELDNREAYETSLIENLQRKTMNPIEEGAAFKRYVEEHGYGGTSELARRIGKSHTYVSRRIALLSLPDRLKEEVVRGRTSPGVASELLSLDGESRMRIAEYITEVNAATREEVRELIKGNRLRRKAWNHRYNVPPSYFELAEMRKHVIERAISKCIASTKQNVNRFDEAIILLDEKDEKSWIVLESLLFYRRLLNRNIDDFIRLRKKLRSSNPRGRPLR
jgi:ParB family transcriptional regulator, chromosome partitioning protein